MHPESEELRVTLAALVNLIRLMGAELVTGARRDDLSRLEAAMRQKISAIDTAEFSPDAAAVGLANASRIVDQVILQIRQQAEPRSFTRPHLLN